MLLFSARQLRKICTVELLSARCVQSFRAVREQEVGRILRGVRAVSSTPPAEAVNLSKQISSYIADSAVRTIIGSRFKGQNTFFRLMEQELKLFSGPSLPDLYPSSRLAMLVSRMKRQRVETMAFMDTIIQKHKIREADVEDLVDVLLRIQREGELQFPIAMDSINAVVADLFVAGSTTSATTLQWAMYELVKNPGVMQKTQEEIRRVLEEQDRVTEGSLSKLHYLQSIKEMLRLHPPAPLLLSRECHNPCRILGFDVPEGSRSSALPPSV